MFSHGVVATTRSFLLALLTGVSAAAFSTQASGQTGQTAESQEHIIAFDIAPQPLSSALSEFARQAGVRALYAYDELRAINTPGLRGSYTREQALAQLLERSGYEARVNENNVIELEGASRPQGVRDDASSQAPSSDSNQPQQTRNTLNPRSSTEEDEDAIVVVGTNIRGIYPSSSPVEIYTAEDIARTGATTTEQFIQKLPQNLGTRAQFGGTGLNRENISSVDLRGLGIGTTLILLNGRRLALADSGQAVDVSLIPMSTIERVEILTDGASAIYGSDAVGGVVNFILRDDFEGAETRLSYGGVTDGGLRQGAFTQTLGTNWGSGRGLISYDYFDVSALDASDRPYSLEAGQRTLTPHSLRHSLLATLSQDIGERAILSVDIALSSRDTKAESQNITSANSLNHTESINWFETEQLFTNVGLDYKITQSLDFTMTASYSKIDVEGNGINTQFNRIPPTFTTSTRRGDHSALNLTAMLGGSLYELPGGPVRFSIGADLLIEDYKGRSAFGADSTRGLGRKTTSLFGEMFAPLISDEQGAPLAHRLELSLAARHTSYEDTSQPALNQDFGNGFSPKVGILWSPLSSLNLRGTFGKSFRAPTLSQLDPSGAESNLFDSIPIPLSGGPLSAVLFLLESPSADLRPETAETYTLGVDFRPKSLSGFELNATYFSIDYTDRIATATIIGSPFSDPTLHSDVLYHANSADVIERLLLTNPTTLNATSIDLSDPAAAAVLLAANPNFWVLDLRFRNLALSLQQGWDLTIRNRFKSRFGEVTFGGQITYILDYEQRNSPSAPILSVVDAVRSPADMRGRVYANLARDGLDTTLSLNYVDDYANPAAVGGPQDVESWTTADWNTRYSFHNGGPLGGVSLNLSIQNLFDEEPPFVAGGPFSGGLGESVGFDFANANPLGRVVVLELSKTW